MLDIRYSFVLPDQVLCSALYLSTHFSPHFHHLMYSLLHFVNLEGTTQYRTSKTPPYSDWKSTRDTVRKDLQIQVVLKNFMFTATHLVFRK